MKAVFFIALATLSFNSFAVTVVDSLYENPEYTSLSRGVASSTQFCIVDQNQRVFGKSCYSSESLCVKRLDFWKDLPGEKPVSCAKI